MKKILFNNNGFINIAIIIFLVAIYFVLFMFGTRGYGYMGYYGYRRGPSFWYMGSSSRYYYGDSVRHGSYGRRSYRGGGMRGGK